MLDQDAHSKGIHGQSLSGFPSPNVSDHLIQARIQNLERSESLSFLHRLPTKELPVFFHSPFLLPDMENAVELILKYIVSGEKILLYGDRDSDGVSSTAILSHFIKKNYPKAKFESITSSQNDAYGLCPEAIQRIKKSKPKLLVTLDFGTSNFEEILELQNLGIQTIILDHHETPERIPPGCLVNPKRSDSIYPDRKICTAFLALKLSLAILFHESQEYNKIYMIREDLFGGKLFRNGIPWNPGSDFSLSEAVEISPDTLPGPVSLPLENRIFYHQLQNIPGILRHQYEYSGLAGIGTITDMMPLIGENRSLVKLSCHFLAYSLQGKISGTPGLNQILQNLKLRADKVTSKDLGWGIGPLLNAAGRMGKTELAFDLLLADEDETAKIKTVELIKTNEERKERTKRNIHKVELYFQRHPDKTQKPIIFCYEPDMEPGVSGIVATRMVETYSKPAIFITPDHGKARGSIRCYGSENVLDLLKTAEDLLDQYGGHPEAGGFAVELDRIPELEERFYATSKKWLDDNNTKFIPIQSDLLCNPSDLSKKLLDELELLEPTGQGNPPILISLKDVQPVHFNFMGDGKHARFRIMGAGSMKFVIWNSAERLSKYLSLQPTVSLWGNLEENHFNGKTSLQFMVQHFE